MNLEDLTPEQQERARSAKSLEEVLALAQETGYELSDEELESVSGGGWDDVCWQDCIGYKDCPCVTHDSIH